MRFVDRYIDGGSWFFFGKGNLMATAVQPATEETFAQQWKDVLAEILPRQGNWSEEEYLVLTDHRTRLVEFTDGFVEALPMPTISHQNVLKFLFLTFLKFFESRGGTVQFSGVRLRIRPWKFREPDLLVLLSSTDPRAQEDRYYHGADLVVEVVSKDKPERDLVEKRGDYAEGRVPEYWIVNPLTETITVLTLRGNAYEDAGTYRRGEAAKSVLNPEFSVAVAEVFDAARK
jgi:Uma2 family endonuclease